MQDTYLRVIALDKIEHAAAEISKMKQHMDPWMMSSAKKSSKKHML